MNSESEQRKSLQELKQINQTNTEQPPTPITPIVIQCPMPEGMNRLTQQADEMCWEMHAMREYLPNLKTYTDLTAVQSSLGKIQNSLMKLISLVEQAGKPNEKRLSLPKVKLPKPHLSPMLLFALPILLALWAAWYGLGMLWNALKILLL